MKYFILPVLLLVAASGFAQEKVIADKIAGIVGDKIILKSELATAIADKIGRAHV